MAEHRVLLLGLGFWGTKWMRAIADSHRCRLVGVAGGESHVARLARDYDLSRVEIHGDYRLAIEKTTADIVIVAIPTLHHVVAAESALKRGANVLSEKPLAANLGEARVALELTKKYPGLKYMVNQNYRWRPHNQTLKQAIAEEMIGRIGSIHCEFRQPEDLLGYREFLEMPLLQDVSIHHFDLIRFLSGRNCEHVYAYSYRPSWSRFAGLPATEAVLVMEGGITVNYNATWAARGKRTSWDGDITITGDKGSLVLDAVQAVHFCPAGASESSLLDKVEMKLTELDYALESFINCIENGIVPETTVEDNFHSFAMVCAAEASVRSGSRVLLSEDRE